MNKKLIVLLLIVTVLTGCSKKNTEVDALKLEVKEVKETLKLEQEKNASLSDEIATLKKSFDKYEFNAETISFKQKLEMSFVVRDKIIGDDYYPYYIVAETDDQDHNTPLLIAVEKETVYQSLEVGNQYSFDVLVQIVIDQENNIQRFMYYLQ